MPTNADLVYLDSSALVKLIGNEPESRALMEYLAGQPTLASSRLSSVEVLRAVFRQDPALTRRAETLLAATRMVALAEPVLKLAAQIGPPTLRSLDAIHLAAALTLGDEVDELITYDRRMAEAATDLGFKAASPK